MSGDKTTITIDRDIALRFSKLAREQGLSIQKLASDALRIVEEVVKDGGSPMDLLCTWRGVRSMSATDTMVLPMTILLKVFEEFQPGKFTPDFYEAGKEIGTAMLQEIPFIDIVRHPSIFKILFPLRSANSRETEREIIFTLAVPPYCKRLTSLLSAYIRGILDAYGYTQHKIEVREHIIEIIVYKSLQT